MEISKRTYREIASEFKKTRSETVFTELYNKMKPGLWKYVNNILKDPELTEDVVSTTLTTIYLKIDQYNEDYQITTWAYRIAYNDAIGQMRKRNKNISMGVFEEKGIDITQNSVLEDRNIDLDLELHHTEAEIKLNKKFNLTLAAINSLPMLYQPYMIHRFLDNKSYNDIYHEMSKKTPGISLQTVKNRIFRGRKLIRQKLETELVFQKD